MLTLPRGWDLSDEQPLRFLAIAADLPWIWLPRHLPRLPRPGEDDEPQFSPDGKMLLFQRRQRPRRWLGRRRGHLDVEPMSPADGTGLRHAPDPAESGTDGRLAADPSIEHTPK